MGGKLLILANNSLGLYRFRADLIRTLGQTYTVYASTPRNDHFDDLASIGCHVIETGIDRRGLNPIRDLRLLRTYRRLIREIRPDLVITYTIKCNVYGGYAARRAGVPYAVNVTGLGSAFQHPGLLRRVATCLCRIGLKRAGVVFFENSDNRDVYCRLGIVRQDVCHVLHGAGVNLEQFPLTPYPTDGTVTRFLFIGRVMREKGVDELFAAMRSLRAAGQSCVLHVVGDTEEDYRARLHEGEEAGWLVYHGYQTDVHPFIVEAHCLVLPSYHEGMANVNLESASMGRPLITSRIPGCMEAVREGETGYLCAPQDTDSLLDAMQRFLLLSPAEREAMGRAGRAHMEAEFDKRQVVAETAACLQACVSASR